MEYDELSDYAQASIEVICAVISLDGEVSEEESTVVTAVIVAQLQDELGVEIADEEDGPEIVADLLEVAFDRITSFGSAEGFVEDLVERLEEEDYQGVFANALVASRIQYYGEDEEAEDEFIDLLADVFELDENTINDMMEESDDVTYQLRIDLGFEEEE